MPALLIALHEPGLRPAHVGLPQLRRTGGMCKGRSEPRAEIYCGIRLGAAPGRTRTVRPKVYPALLTGYFDKLLASYEAARQAAEAGNRAQVLKFVELVHDRMRAEQNEWHLRRINVDESFARMVHDALRM
jgi:hypothetical protein